MLSLLFDKVSLSSVSLLRCCRNVGHVLLIVGVAVYLPIASANQPEVLFVEMEKRGSVWTAQVTVRHGDTGWEHYADAWRILDSEGKVLGTRTLYHPHENEQPFTRSLTGVKIPSSVSEVDVQAHDKVHGWGEKMRVKLTPGENDRYRVR